LAPVSMIVGLPNMLRCNVQKGLTVVASVTGGNALKFGVGNGPVRGIVGSSKRAGSSPPRYSDVVMEYGVGQNIGHCALDMDTRIRCPTGNIQDVKCMSTRSV